jgi:tetratricopeptide (TPR) repeat protein
MTAKNLPAKPVFLSYARDESAKYATALWETLGGEQGEAFLDRSAIHYGQQFARCIINGIFAAKVIVLFVGETYFTKRYCLFERDLALAHYNDVKNYPEQTTPAFLDRTLQSVVVALPVQQDNTQIEALLSGLPAALRKASWPKANEAEELAALVREKLTENRRTLAARLGKSKAAIHRHHFQERMSLPATIEHSKNVPHFPSRLPDSSKSFSGRSQQLEELHTRLLDRRRVSICGAAGLGKTRLAIEYVHRYGLDHFPGGVFWLDADKDDIGLEDQFYGIARVLRDSMPERASEPAIPELMSLRDKKSSIQALLRSELKSAPATKQILFILDSVPERVGPEKGVPLSDFYADCNQVSLLVTSRDLILEHETSPMRLPLLDTGASVALLTHDVDRKQEITFANWSKIAGWVGHFPLALDLLNCTLRGGVIAPAFVLQAAEDHVGPADAVDRLSTGFRASLGDCVTGASVAGICAALRFSFDKLTEPARTAAQLIAQFGPFPLPFLLWDNLPAEIVTDSVEIELTARNFLAYPHQRSRGRMHAVLGDFIRELDRTDRKNLALASTGLERAMGQIGRRMHSELWPELNDCCLHAETVFEHGWTRPDLDEEQVRTLINCILLAGDIQQAQRYLDEADVLLKKGLKESRARLGEGHEASLIARLKIADVADDRGNTADAKELQEEALAIAKAQRSYDSPLVTATEVLLGKKTSLPVENSIQPGQSNETSNSDYILSKAELLRFFRTPTEWTRGIQFGRSLVEKYSRDFGKDHAWALEIMTRLAQILYFHGDAHEALNLRLKVRDGLERAGIPPSDIRVSQAFLDLAESLTSVGDLEGAQREQRKAVLNRRKFFKRRHPETWNAEAALAETMQERGEHDKSVRLLNRIVTSARRLLGQTHYNTLKWIFSLSETLKKQGHHSEAARIVEQTLVLLQQEPDRVDEVATWKHRLAAILSAQGNLDGAFDLDMEVLKLREQRLGPENPATLKSRIRVATRMRQRGELETAFRTQAEILDAWRRIEGNESAETVLAMVRLANTAEQMGNVTTAATLAAEARKIAIRIVGPQHSIFEQLSKLAATRTSSF